MLYLGSRQRSPLPRIGGRAEGRIRAAFTGDVMGDVVGGHVREVHVHLAGAVVGAARKSAVGVVCTEDQAQWIGRAHRLQGGRINIELRIGGAHVRRGRIPRRADGHRHRPADGIGCNQRIGGVVVHHRETHHVAVIQREGVVGTIEIVVFHTDMNLVGAQIDIRAAAVVPGNRHAALIQCRGAGLPAAVTRPIAEDTVIDDHRAGVVEHVEIGGEVRPGDITRPGVVDTAAGILDQTGDAVGAGGDLSIGHVGPPVDGKATHNRAIGIVVGHLPVTVQTVAGTQTVATAVVVGVINRRRDRVGSGAVEGVYRGGGKLDEFPGAGRPGIVGIAERTAVGGRIVGDVVGNPRTDIYVHLRIGIGRSP